VTITAELTALPAVAATDEPCPGRHDPLDHPHGAPVWCLGCARAIAAGLRRIPTLTAQVAVNRDGTLVRGRGAAMEVRVARLDPASPSPAWDVVDHVLRWARGWADTLASQLGRWDDDPGDLTPAGLPVYDLAADVTYLEHHLTPLLVGPDAVEAGRAVLSMARHLERGAGQEAAKHPLQAPCPACDRLSLWRLDGSERVECAAPGCGAVMTWEEYLRAAAALAARAQRVRRRAGGGAA
jgi:Zn ribbon nucleic-acid-binding protein